MIVVDASAVVEYLLRIEQWPALAAAISESDALAAPDLISYEVGSVLRRHYIRGELTDERARQCFEQFNDLRLELHPISEFADRVWQMCNNLTYYDAAYVALAEFLNLPLYTMDHRLAAVPGSSVQIVAL